MAVLSKIRQRSLLLIVVIGFCLFAFIIGDLVHSNLFNRTSRNIGSVNGKDITVEEFRLKVDNVEKGGQQGMTPTQAVNQVWNQEVSIALLTAEFEKLGLKVSENQVMETLKQSQDIGQNPQFLNAAGLFDQAKFDEFFKANPTMAKMLADRKKDAELNSKFQIYSTLVKAGSYSTTSEGKLKYQMEADKVNFDYVSVLFSSIKDSDVKIADSEILDHMRKNEKKYKADETRELEYVIIEDKPSAEDLAEVKNSVNALLAPSAVYNKATGKNDTIPSFKNASNVAEFVNNNSDIPYDSSYVAKKDLPAPFAEALFNLPAGEVYGPYEYNNGYYLSKSLGRQAGANAKASHILLAYKGATRANPAVTRTKEEAQAKANELLAQVNANPDSFMVLAMTNSDDSSKQQGGDLGYFSKGQMTPKFNDFVFNNPVGKVGLVETEFGFHIIKVTDKQDAVRLATIAKKIEASEATTDKTYAQAVKFEMDATTKPFETVAKENKLTIAPVAKVKAIDETVGSVGNQRQIVKWAYNKDTNVGDVKRFDVVNVGHIIAKLKKVNAEGLMAIDDARLSIEPLLKNKKKAEKIKAKMKGATLEAIAAASGSKVQSAIDRTLENAVLEGVGQEQKVVGTAFAIGVNKVSAPIDGNSGVYVVKPTVVTKAPAIKVYADYVNKLKAQNANGAGRVIGALKADADIKDNRSMFY